MEEGGAGRLVLVATPIGNLDDLSPRAARALADADLVACEDTRRTGRLLAHIGADTPTISFHEHNEQQRVGTLLERVAGGAVVAVASDAGTPSVSDPGFDLVRAAAARGLAIEAIPGPSAVLCALVISGLPTDRFAFEGFLPRKAGPRDRRIAEVARDPRTLVYHLAPHRAAQELTALAAGLGDRPAVLARELTKLHEETWRGTLGRLAERAADGVRGEVTLVVAGAPPPEGPPPADELAERVRALVATGRDKKAAIAEVATATGAPKRDVYQAVLDTGRVR